ncbi:MULTISPECIES: S8 family serine peptidase [Thiorhodovibrio]|uniref:S8 family serine peptidase n=1 Tax=Thiorhodovibrio TaxID=61593 RepID=UPI001912AAD2|nr:MULTISPECIES: S8 family serine peptidase [Thiorhodovibrio]MBK5970224.1 hypothetical protein [Thiorhodovibrio winogradskyi]WPL12727.1 Minor extracellular protease vpr precursor [Thiorhodovibrio litoralis]
MTYRPARKKLSTATVLLRVGISMLGLFLATDVIPAEAPAVSHRLIVELEQPGLALWSKLRGLDDPETGRLRLDTSRSREHLRQVEQEQQQFRTALKRVLPGARIDTYINEEGLSRESRFQLLLNAVVIDPGTRDRKSASKQLAMLPGVKRVHRDYAYYPTLYAGVPLVGADELWWHPLIGSQSLAGKGIKVASVDAGIHHEAPMFDGTGFAYPPLFPPGGLGHTENNNGKIISSRAYFRSWDPPAVGDENPWPGENGSSHGVHTAGIMAGNPVEADYLGKTISISGVAPAAWVMSYRVGYPSVNSNEEFYTVELIAALEDVVADGADVVNNSWGDGPVSLGGKDDALDAALIGAAEAGVFVVMAAGNSGPGGGTTEHPSDQYMVVGATTTDGTYSAGFADVGTDCPVDAVLQDLRFATALFGPELEQGIAYSYSRVTAASVDNGNDDGCAPFPEHSMQGAAVLIRRGDCAFGEKVLNAQAAGAELAVIYNNSGDEEDIQDMTCDAEICPAGSVTIPSIFISLPAGEALGALAVNCPDDLGITLDMNARQIGNTPDVAIDFSSRGPSLGARLKPDIAAPGVNILSQGYADGATGEDRHLGFGQISGTSMAAPFVAGAAALLRQMYPRWPNSYIKSALMTTAEYRSILNWDDSAAQPLDVGAGRINLPAAADPGVIINPPSVSFGLLRDGDTATLEIKVRNISARKETYRVSSLFTGQGIDNATDMPGISLSADEITLAPLASAVVTVSFNSLLSGGLGDHQGYLVLSGNQGHSAHMPVWARVMPLPTEKILIIDNDFSGMFPDDFSDYRTYYTDALDALGYDYAVLDVDAAAGGLTTLPSAAELGGYRAIIYFSGDNASPDGSFAMPSALTTQDMDRLAEYAGSGGAIIAMGQDLSYIMNGAFLYRYVLGGDRLQDSVTAEALPQLPVVPVFGVPAGFHGISIDLGAGGDGAANQLSIDELAEMGPMDDQFGLSSPLLRYPGDHTVAEGIVAKLSRQQPTLESPGLTWLGRAAYTAFGLEGVNSDHGTTRAELLGLLLDWAFDEPSVSLQNTTSENASGLSMFEAVLTADTQAAATAMQYRWDFGDGSAIVTATDNMSSHVYTKPGTYRVRVEATDGLGNHAIGSLPVRIRRQDLQGHR